jgi:hypothetical protein
MKKTLLICFLMVLTHQAISQEDGEQNVGTIPSSEANIGSVDVNKLQKPRGRVKKPTTAPPSDSSSFIGDPDSLDPLNPNRDNLKDDEEPVLEDIRDVLNTDIKKKPAPAVPASSDNSSAAAGAAELPPPAVAETPADAPPAEAPPAPEVITEAPPPAEPPPVEVPVAETPQPEAPPAGSGLMPDEPDLALEKKFHDIYRLYNINPTPDDMWAAATAKQTARLYEVQKGDTLWSISKILFGDPNFWPKLWAINKQGILNPHFINPKMKILFFEGTEESAPTLTVGENEPVQPPLDLNAETPPAGVTDSNVVLTDDLPVPPPLGEAAPKTVQEEQTIEDQFKVERKAAVKPIPIPPSIPESYNEKYYGSSKPKDVKINIDLSRPIEPNPVFVNDIVITDIPAKTDIEITNEETLRMRCYPGRLLKDIKLIGNELLTEYDLYEELDGVDTSTGFKNAYRLVGSARSYQNKYLRVTSCKAFMSETLIILPKNRMKELSTQKISEVEEVKIIGGPDIRSQIFYTTQQYAYVDFGTQNYQVGQEFTTISNLTDQANATFRIIEKYGSYAVVVITSMRDNLEIGDKVVLQ